jgi:hypothetical protein
MASGRHSFNAQNAVIVNTRRVWEGAKSERRGARSRSQGEINESLSARAKERNLKVKERRISE